MGTWSVAGDTTMTTTGDLIDGTNYTVSVTAINCAGSSNSSSVSVQTCEWCVSVCVCEYVCVVCVCVDMVLTRSLCSALRSS